MRPTLFALITYSVIPVLVAPVILLSIALAFSRTMQFGPEQADAAWNLLLFALMALFLAPVGGVLFTLIGTLFWHIFVGPRRQAGFKETYRIGAYLSLPYLVSSFLPLIGLVLALGVTGYVGTAGIRGAHDTTKARAAMSVFVSMLFGISASFLFAFILVASMDPPAGL